MEIIFSKQEEQFKAKTFVINMLKLHTNPKVLIQGFVTYSISLSCIISMPIPLKNIFLVEIRCKIVIGVES